METEIDKDTLEYGKAWISFNGSPSVFKGWIRGVQAFAFPVQIIDLGSDIGTGHKCSFQQCLAESMSANARVISTKQWPSLFESLLVRDYDWSGPTFYLESPDTDKGTTTIRYSTGEYKQRVELALTWLEDCHHRHHLCKPDVWCSFSPTRLIDVERCRLIETQQQAVPLRYAALTHCWGPSMPEAGITKRQTLLSRKENIDILALPNSFRDALIIAKSLGIPYLWIDSLCIIQDSIEDWEAESAQMGLVYSNAWCTIAASSAASCHDGIQLTRKDVATPCEFSLDSFHEHRIKLKIFLPRPTWETFYSNNPLNKRGWTFQECELSPRILHFSADQMWWECRTLRREEDTTPDDDDLEDPAPNREPVRVQTLKEDIKDIIVHGIPSVTRAVQLRCLDNMLMACKALTPLTQSSMLHNVVVTEARYNTWHQAIQDYTGRTFTRISDRFPALSGLARQMETMHGGEYVAGAWRDDLLRSLLWRRDPKSIVSSPKPPRRPLEYRAPSWSWAAIDEAVTYDLVTLNRLQIDKLASTTAQIEKVKLIPAGSDPKGRLKGGFIRIRGRLKPYSLSTVTETMAFHFDFEDETEEDPVFLLSLYARWFTRGIILQQRKFGGATVWANAATADMAWALALVMVEGPVPVFRGVGVVSNILAEWFDDATDVMIKIILR